MVITLRYADGGYTVAEGTVRLAWWQRWLLPRLEMQVERVHRGLDV